MIQKFRGEFVAQGAGLAELSGLLSWSLTEVSKQGLPGPSVWSRSGGSDDRVNNSSGSRRQQRQQSVKTLTFGGSEVCKMSVEYPEPEVRLVLPEIRDLAFIQATKKNLTSSWISVPAAISLLVSPAGHGLRCPRSLSCSSTASAPTCDDPLWKCIRPSCW